MALIGVDGSLNTIHSFHTQEIQLNKILGGTNFRAIFRPQNTRKLVPHENFYIYSIHHKYFDRGGWAVKTQLK